MDAESLKLEQQAYDFIAHSGSELVKRFADPTIYKPVERPVSLFMAGSSGAGKTEVSIGLVKRFTTRPIRIDADEIRQLCPGYTGGNAHVFQKAATKGVNMLFDYALHKNIHAILDGTFAYADAPKNIERSLKHNRIVELWFVYQDPLVAWEFTKVREIKECRHVDKDIFIRGFFNAKANAINVKTAFGSNLTLNLLVKNIDNTDGELFLNIQANDLDHRIGQVYTEGELRGLLL